MKKAVGTLVAGCLALMPALALSWTNDGVPTDPILSLQYPKSQTSFPKASRSILNACTDPTYGSAWIFAMAKRPEGDYLLVYGPVWVTPDAPGRPQPVLEYGTNGAVALIKPDGKCQQLWDTDNAFNNFFPANPNDKPNQAQVSIIHDLAIDLIRRAELSLGGKQQFLSALDATGHADSEQDEVMIPLLNQLRR